MTNNPKKIEALTKLGIEVIDRIPIEVVANNDNVGYLKTKAKRMAHFLFNSNTKP
jgi:3,4-dihydroxy 2-butanone 4-phosphate synthase/GTP cyclohydrolase II